MHENDNVRVIFSPSAARVVTLTITRVAGIEGRRRNCWSRVCTGAGVFVFFFFWRRSELWWPGHVGDEETSFAERAHSVAMSCIGVPFVGARARHAVALQFGDCVRKTVHFV